MLPISTLSITPETENFSFEKTSKLLTKADPSQNTNHNLATLDKDASDANIMSNDQSVSMSPLNRIPLEIRLRIFKYSFKAVDEVIDVTIPSHDRVRAHPKPVLGVGLLRTCHQFYHEARPYLYLKKKLLFARYGWELLAWTKPMGLPRCKELGCAAAEYRPVLDQATLCIGHERNPGHGQTSIMGFDTTLQQILNAGGIRINKLVIKFATHSFHLTYRPFMLAQRLQAITGVERVEIEGGGLNREDREELYIALFGVRQFVDYFHWFQHRNIHCADLVDNGTPDSPANPPCHTPARTPARIAAPNSMHVDPQLLCHVDQQLSRLLV